MKGLIAAMVASGTCFANVALAQDVDVDVDVVPDPGAGSGTEFVAIGGILTTEIEGPVTLYVQGVRVEGDLEGWAVGGGLQFDLESAGRLRVGYFGLHLDGSAERPDPQDDRFRVEYQIGRNVDVLDVPVQLLHRSRFEYRFRDIDDQFRWRPELRATFRPGKTVSPFFSVEPFLDVTDGEYQQTALEAGLAIRLSDSVVFRPSWTYSAVPGRPDNGFGLLLLGVRF